ncbi:MAG: hypothetical protein KDH84_24020, partial [Calditrichaeota bacterium]|nr:hypothetical protein [Calditrichota bacterium]
MFAFGDVCPSDVIGLCCHCEERRDEAISCKGLPMVVGVQVSVAIIVPAARLAAPFVGLPRRKQSGSQ